MDTKTAIGIPHLGPIRPYFFDTVLNLVRNRTDYVVRVEDKPIDLARNLIVRTALADPATTHVFFMDSDMRFPAHALARLASDRRPIVGGVYMQRGGTPTPHVYDFHHQDNPDGSCPLNRPHAGREAGRWYAPKVREFAAYLKAHPQHVEHEAEAVLPRSADDLLECDAIATGCLLIAREVLEKIAADHPEDPNPWFKSHADTGGGEDFYFCQRAKEAGYSVFADLAVQCSHEFRYAWLDRGDFVDLYGIGRPDEHSFDELDPIEIDVAPQQQEPIEFPLAAKVEAAS